MPKYVITSPDGKKYEVTAPDGASESEIMNFVMSQHAPQKAEPEQPKLDDPSFLVGMGKRFNEAARGLGFDGVKPYAPADKRIDESTAGKLGGIAADMAITAPAGLAGGALARTALTGITEGLTNKDDRIENALTGAAGAGFGEALGGALKFAAQPFKSVTNPVKDDLIAKATAMGIPLNAAQETGNKTLQFADKRLSSLPSSSSFQQAQKDTQRQAWQKALFLAGGENADSATADVMGAMKDRISKSYNNIHGRNHLIVDQELKDALSKVEQEQLNRLPTNQKPVIQSYLDDFGALNIGDKMTGKQYQDLRSMLDKQSKGFKNSDPLTSVWAWLPFPQSEHRTYCCNIQFLQQHGLPIPLQGYAVGSGSVKSCEPPPLHSGPCSEMMRDTTPQCQPLKAGWYACRKSTRQIAFQSRAKTNGNELRYMRMGITTR